EKVNYTIQSYRDKLIRHFNDEDEILFPKVKGKDSALDNRVDEIINEHREIESLVEELKTADKPETVLNKLGYLLESHIRKEERELFVKFQEVLTEEELSEIEIKLKSER
ncbi:MAG TPA: hemerythrin domain-containing protein, partial [Ignavibacteriales bacterium]|nr:hemerythrin domain-containing protein [Ignavibacteriales bacterium]